MLITDPERLTAFDAAARRWQGIPSLEVTRGGRVFVAFYSGNITETLGNYCVLLKSDDGGATFSEPIAAAYAGENFRCYDPTLWEDPLGRLWFTWAQAPEHSVWAAVCDAPEDAPLTWSEPRRIGGDVMMNKPTVTGDGRWLFPMAVWRKALLSGHLMSPSTPEGSFAVETRDGGKTFTPIGASRVEDRWFDEHMIVEKRDGRLWMLVRTGYGIGQSFSEDGGHTWSAGEDSGLGGPNSRFHIRRLPSGNLLLVNHRGGQGRTNLTAWVSRDDGETWEGGLLLDGRANVSYPDAGFHDGWIYITYDRERRARYGNTEYLTQAGEILLARVTEADILAGRLVTAGAWLQKTVSRLYP